ncbi:DinB family protein [Daejeonella oryzae]|uniref:DinB family protein n=1 Tax=Daejeonella oryzae TaxID=1122943 RepID=UPI00040AB7C4|nr:DinB family protein [Daejeonella oryzae]
MSIGSQQRSILKSVDEYSKLLESISEEDFQRSPEEGWSYSEVYSHIFQANLVSLVAAEKCINGTGEKTDKRIHWIPRAILFFGRFPPGKFKAPERIAAMVAKIDKEQARNLIVKFKTRLAEISPRIDKALANVKVVHPRLGLLNARQWFRFVEIHTRHHQKQLVRIQMMFNSAKN